MKFDEKKMVDVPEGPPVDEIFNMKYVTKFD